MSLATWKAEFYPTSAQDQTPDTAVAHALRKWVGLRKEHLERHGVTHRARNSDLEGEIDEPVFTLTTSTCALCELYFSPEDDDACVSCPLCISRAGVPCDMGDDPYGAFVSAEQPTPEPMIAALEKIQQKEGTDDV